MEVQEFKDGPSYTLFMMLTWAVSDPVLNEINALKMNGGR